MSVFIMTRSISWSRDYRRKKLGCRHDRDAVEGPYRQQVPAISGDEADPGEQNVRVEDGYEAHCRSS